MPEICPIFKPHIQPLPGSDAPSLRSTSHDIDGEMQRLKKVNDETIQAWLSTDEILKESREEFKRLGRMFFALAMSDPPTELRARSSKNTILSAHANLTNALIPEAAERSLDLLDRHYCTSSRANELGRALAALESFVVDSKRSGPHGRSGFPRVRDTQRNWKAHH